MNYSSSSAVTIPGDARNIVSDYSSDDDDKYVSLWEVLGGGYYWVPPGLKLRDISLKDALLIAQRVGYDKLTGNGSLRQQVFSLCKTGDVNPEFLTRRILVTLSRRQTKVSRSTSLNKANLINLLLGTFYQEPNC